MAQFPTIRLRRLRKTPALLQLVSETRLSVDQLIYPLFISETITHPRPIVSMPGINQWTVTSVLKEIERVKKLGISSILLFGIPRKKDTLGSEAYNKNGIVQKAIKKIKKTFSDLLVITDVCLCEYTDHGHCGMIDTKGNIINDTSLPLLSRMALSHAEAGADMIAPSDMMDGRIGAIRKTLDDNGFSNIPIMAYSAKYASSFYGPFRDAAESPPQFGNRTSYQMNPTNVREALREIALDVEEGADIIMVKPALSYMDVIRCARDTFDLPLAAYSVSGEYAMVKAAAQHGWIDEKKIVLEMMTGIKRAGADIIITYFAPDIAKWIKE